MPDFSKPYLHKAIVDILRHTVFNSRSSVGTKNPQLFESNHPEFDDQVVPHALLSLVATAVSVRLKCPSYTHDLLSDLFRSSRVAFG
jgi:hypothetical protein